jgi:hypothetical protein
MSIEPGYNPRYDLFEMRRVYGFFIYTRDKTCPRCGSMHVHRTKRGRILEFWILLFVPVRPYRCGKCRQRFYGPKTFIEPKLDVIEKPLSADAVASPSRRHSEPPRVFRD